MAFSYLFLFLTLYFSTSAAEEGWCYDIEAKTNTACKGSCKWSNENNTCGGSKQSPVSIVTGDALLNSNLVSIKFEGYDKEQDCALNNSGHSAQLTLDVHQTIVISDGGLPGTYTAAQLHFHWGSTDNPGSEHSLNGKKYPIELHIVHTKKTARSESGGGSEGYAVLGFFIEEGAENGNYDNLIKGLARITQYGVSTTISKVKLQDLIPQEDLTLFYRYEGSLTTPPCNETVIWTVFPQTIKLSKTQIEEFRKLQYKDTKVMEENFRPIQELNGRKIYTSSVDIILPHSRYLLISLFVFYLTSLS